MGSSKMLIAARNRCWSRLTHKQWWDLDAAIRAIDSGAPRVQGPPKGTGGETPAPYLSMGRARHEKSQAAEKERQAAAVQKSDKVC